MYGQGKYTPMNFHNRFIRQIEKPDYIIKSIGLTYFDRISSGLDYRLVKNVLITIKM